MKEVYSFKEDDRKYRGYEPSQDDLELLNKYFNYQFSADTKIVCFYDYKDNFLAVQVHEGNSTWELTPEEFEKIFKKIPD